MDFKKQVVPVMYFRGSYGSALINFINAHDGWFTTFPEATLGRSEGAMYMSTENKKLSYRQNFDMCITLPDHLRIAAKSKGHHHFLERDWRSELTYASDYYDKSVLIDIKNSSFRSEVKKRHKVVKEESILMRYNGEEILSESEIDKLIDETVDDFLEEAEYVADSYDNTFILHFDDLIKKDIPWYNELSDYLKLNKFEHPLRYWQNQFWAKEDKKIRDLKNA
ncbi:MAG: hypothetical protein ACR2MS_06060 [Weeksellaceae bacterium]